MSATHPSPPSGPHSAPTAGRVSATPHLTTGVVSGAGIPTRATMPLTTVVGSTWQGRSSFPGTEHLNPAEIFATPGYQAPTRRTSSCAVIAFIASVLFFLPGAGLVAIASGWLALTRIPHRYQNGESLAWFGVIAGALGCLLWLLIIITMTME